ncbi:CDT1-like protein [Drosera capensis]
MTTLCQESKYSRSVDAGNHFPERKETPIKLVFTPSKYMDSHTPALVPPKRSSMSPDKCSPSTSNMNVKHPSCARVLNFDSPVEKATVELELSDTESNDLLDIVPENLLKLEIYIDGRRSGVSQGATLGGDSQRSKVGSGRWALKQKERTPDEQAMWRKTIAGVPKIFDRILYLFQCAKTSFIEREELIIKLTEFHSDIVDESEIMEQLKLLREIIPEWISEKMSSSMSILYCINKTLSPDVLRARIEKAA